MYTSGTYTGGRARVVPCMGVRHGTGPARPGPAHPLVRAPRLVSVPHLIIVPLRDSLPPSTSTINSSFAVIRRQHDYSQRPGRSPDVRR